MLHLVSRFHVPYIDLRCLRAQLRVGGIEIGMFVTSWCLGRGLTGYDVTGKESHSINMRRAEILESS